MVNFAEIKKWEICQAQVFTAFTSILNLSSYKKNINVMHSKYTSPQLCDTNNIVKSHTMAATFYEVCESLHLSHWPMTFENMQTHREMLVYIFSFSLTSHRNFHKSNTNAAWALRRQFSLFIHWDWCCAKRTNNRLWCHIHIVWCFCDALHSNSYICKYIHYSHSEAKKKHHISTIEIPTNRNFVTFYTMLP